MTNKHTPGPWHVGNGGYSHGGVFEIHADIEGVDWYVAEVPWGSPELDGGVPVHHIAQSNARLIAAAPELLEALESLFVQGDVQLMFAGNPNACECIEAKCRAAIAKARGE